MSDFVLVNDEMEVKKAKQLVQSRYRLNPLALKLITTLISAVQETDTPEQEYCVRVKDFTDLQGVKGKDYYKKLNKATDEILKSPVKISLGGNDWLKANWCSSITYKEGEGVIKFKISSELLPYIVSLKKNYLKYDLLNILPLKSEYSIRIYEWLKDKLNQKARYGGKADLILSVDEIREKLEIPKTYAYKDIRVQILDKSQIDLEEYCDIKFEWEVVGKIGRKITHIKFKISPNKKNIKKELPPYLDTYLSYVNYLKSLYKNDEVKFFIGLQIDFGEGNKPFYFGINKKGYVYAMPKEGGYGKAIDKATAETILNASYLCALYSEVYRDFISDQECLKELGLDEEQREYFGVIYNEIKVILSKHNCKEKPLI